MRIGIGCDHAGLEVKRAVIEALCRENYEVEDMGVNASEPVDYPDIAKKVAQAVAKRTCDTGILICGTGIGMSMAANKVRGIRAAVCHNKFTVEMSRRHNNANILCLGGRVLSPPEAASLVLGWVKVPFDGGRHSRRVEKIMDLE